MEGFVLVMTYLCMTSRHSALEGWSMAKSYVHEHKSMTTSWLGGMDSTYLFCYATGNIISGFFEDRYSLRILIAAGLALSGLLYSVIITMGYTNNYIPYVFLIHWAFQGLANSTVLPGTVAVVGNWFSKTNRGKVMGTWSTCNSVGNAIGGLIGGVIISSGQEWMVVVITFAIFQIVTAFIYILTVPDKPSVNPNKLIDSEISDYTRSVNDVGEATSKRSIWNNNAMPFKQAILLPGVIAYSLNYACIKSLYYGLGMWLPFFLRNRINHPDLIGALIASLNVGGIFGSICCGWLGDLIKYRSPIITLFLILSLPFLLLLEVGNESIYWIYFIVIPLTGFFIAGVANNVQSAVAADLSQNPEVADNTDAMATIAGIIDGAGGIGAAINTFIMGYLAQVDWLYVFLLMFLLNIVAILCIIQITYRELKSYKKVSEEKKIVILDSVI